MTNWKTTLASPAGSPRSAVDILSMNCLSLCMLSAVRCHSSVQTGYARRIGETLRRPIRTGLGVKPGLTGYGRRKVGIAVCTPERVALDVALVKDLSVRTYWRVVLKTLPVLMARRAVRRGTRFIESIHNSFVQRGHVQVAVRAADDVVTIPKFFPAAGSRSFRRRTCNRCCLPVI